MFSTNETGKPFNIEIIDFRKESNPTKGPMNKYSNLDTMPVADQQKFSAMTAEKKKQFIYGFIDINGNATNDARTAVMEKLIIDNLDVAVNPIIKTLEEIEVIKKNKEITD